MTPRIDARRHLATLVGQTLHTLSGKPNRVVEIRDDDVIVATARSPTGQPVPIADVQAAIDQLFANGELAIEVKTVGYRSAFIGAVLATLPNAEVVEGTRRIRLSQTSKVGGFSVDELRRRLGQFETELREAGLAENSIRTYVDRSDVFIRWLAGDYVPGASGAVPRR